MDKPAQSEKRTLVEEGTELKGTLKSSCQVVVNGAIDGEIQAPALTVTETGSVLGTVRAEKLRSEGTLAGDIDASDVYLSGTVRSNTMIRAKTLEVKLAPERGKLEVTFGECLVEVGEDPAEAHAAAEEGTGAAPANGASEEASVSANSAEEKEPTWSEPPGMAEAGAAAASSTDGQAEETNGTGDAAATDAAAAANADDDDSGNRGKRSKKKKRGDDARESQAPPA